MHHVSMHADPTSRARGSHLYVCGIKIFDQTIYVFPLKFLDRLIYSGSKIKLTFNIIDRVDRFLWVQRSPLSFHQLLNTMLIT